MNPFDFFRGISKRRRLRRAEAGIAAVIHDTDFDERVREIHKKARDYSRHESLGIQQGELSRAVADLYAAFAWRRPSDPFEYCDCCITAAVAAHLRSSPLKSLNADDLYTVSANVPHTVGKLEDILYFTPRILEHAAIESCYLDVPQVFSGFQDHPPVLTDDERAALDGFFGLIWTALRECDPYHPLGITDVVLPTTVLTGKVGHYLDIWRRSPAIYRYIISMGDEGSLGDAFWSPATPAYRSVIDWLKTNRHLLEKELDSIQGTLDAYNRAELIETVRQRLDTRFGSDAA